MDYRLLGEVMGLILNDEYYSEDSVQEVRNSVWCAIDHGKCLVHRVDGVAVGYFVWGFFTQEEIDLDLWNGDEVFKRDAGDVLFFPKFQCRHGRREVVRFVRDVRIYLSENHPDVETAFGLRVYPDGRRRKEKWYLGNWHERFCCPV